MFFDLFIFIYVLLICIYSSFRVFTGPAGYMAAAFRRAGGGAGGPMPWQPPASAARVGARLAPGDGRESRAGAHARCGHVASVLSEKEPLPKKGSKDDVPNPINPKPRNPKIAQNPESLPPALKACKAKAWG